MLNGTILSYRDHESGTEWLFRVVVFSQEDYKSMQHQKLSFTKIKEHYTFVVRSTRRIFRCVLLIVAVQTTLVQRFFKYWLLFPVWDMLSWNILSWWHIELVCRAATFCNMCKLRYTDVELFQKAQPKIFVSSNISRSVTIFVIVNFTGIGPSLSSNIADVSQHPHFSSYIYNACLKCSLESRQEYALAV